MALQERSFVPTPVNIAFQQALSISMRNEELCRRRVCALLQADPPWGVSGREPSHNICDCCGVEFGYEDVRLEGVRKYREEWLRQGASWARPSCKPSGWSPEQQMLNLPEKWR